MLKVIATFILIYLLFRVLTMWVFPLIGRWYLDRYKKRFYRDNPWAAHASERQRGTAGRQGDAREPGMHSGSRRGGQDHGPRRPVSDTDKLGEYVDFEEIDD